VAKNGPKSPPPLTASSSVTLSVGGVGIHDLLDLILVDPQGAEDALADRDRDHLLDLDDPVVAPRLYVP
jgi:hypothetical protein